MSFTSPPPGTDPPRDLWDDLLPWCPHDKPPAADHMLHVIAYDITDDRRRQRFAGLCEDFGVRVQYSLFECWLEADDFDRLWPRLTAAIDPAEDRLVAYLLDGNSAPRRRKAGKTMVLTQRVTCYFV